MEGHRLRICCASCFDGQTVYPWRRIKLLSRVTVVRGKLENGGSLQSAWPSGPHRPMLSPDTWEHLNSTDGRRILLRQAFDYQPQLVTVKRLVLSMIAIARGHCDFDDIAALCDASRASFAPMPLARGGPHQKRR